MTKYILIGAFLFCAQNFFVIGVGLAQEHGAQEKHHDHNHDHDHEPKTKERKPKAERIVAKKTEKAKGLESEGTDTSPRIVIDDTNFKQIFEMNVAARAEELAEKTSKTVVEVEGRILRLKDFGLSNPYFTVQYGEQIQDIPMAEIGGSRVLWSRGEFSISPSISIGYGFKEEKLSVLTPQGTSIADIVALHFIPATLGFEMKQSFNFVGKTSVFITPQLGTLWLRQSGTLDGMEQSKLHSFYGARAGVILFQPKTLAQGDLRESWFDGLSLSTTLQNSFGSSQKINTSSIDLGLRLTL